MLAQQLDSQKIEEHCFFFVFEDTGTLDETIFSSLKYEANKYDGSAEDLFHNRLKPYFLKVFPIIMATK